MLSIRWFPVGEVPRFDLFRQAFHEVRYAWVTLRLDKQGNPSELACAIGPEQWEKGGHHATWFPDGERISKNLDIHYEGSLRLVQVNANGSELRLIHPGVVGSGHQTVYPGGRFILTDT